MKQKHILIADDERNLRNTLQFILEAASYKVSSAGNGQDALQEIINAMKSGSPVDLLITDIQMPGLSGLELINMLNRLHIDIPVLASSGYASPQVLIELIRNGCNDFLEKPIDDRQLLRHVTKLIEHHHLGSPSRQPINEGETE